MKTDLEITQDLEQLCVIINSSIQKATNILDQAKKIDEVKLLITEINATRRSLDSVKNSIDETENRVAITIDEARSIEIDLNGLSRIRQQIDDLGISESLLIELRDVVDQINRFNQLSETSTSLSMKIDNDIKRLDELIPICNKKVLDAKTTLTDLSSALKKLGMVDDTTTLLNELRIASTQLNESRQEINIINMIDRYIRDFKRHRSFNKKIGWLWHKFGISGVIIYFMYLIKPGEAITKLQEK